MGATTDTVVSFIPTNAARTIAPDAERVTITRVAATAEMLRKSTP